MKPKVHAKFFILIIALTAFLEPPAAQAQITFQSFVAYPGGMNDAQTAAIGDFNNDGLNDAAIGTGSDRALFIFLQNTSGTFNSPVLYPRTSLNAKGMDAGDFNNDNLTDVVIAYSDSICIFYQNSSGTMGNAQAFYTGTGSYGVKKGDLNNDGLTDLAVTHWNDPFISVFYQKSSGGFTRTTYPKIVAGYDEIDVADMNDDGLDDVVWLAGQGLSGGPYIFLQNSSGTLNAASGGHTVLSCHGVALGDLNNDGLNDIAVTSGGNSPNAKINIWFQTSSNTFNGPPDTVLQAYDIPEPVELADFNCDGRNEILPIHGGWNKTTSYTQNSSGKYGGYMGYQMPYASHYKPQGMAVGDINNDGKKDMIAADYNNGLIVLTNTSNCGTPLTTTSAFVNATCAGLTDGTATVTPAGGVSPYTYAWSTTPVQTTQTATGLSAGTYSVTVTDANSTKSVKTVTISAPAPVPVSVNIVASDDTVCVGTAITFTATPVNGGSAPAYVWKVNGATVSSGSNQYTTPLLNMGDVVTCELTSNGNCITGSPATSNPVAPAIMPSPNASFVYSVGTGIQVNFISTDSLGDITYYSWDFGDGGSANTANPSHTYGVNDTFNVCLTVYNGSNCSFTYCVDVSTFKTGISELAPSTDWNIYPNPFSDYLVVNSKNGSTAESIELVDVTGRLVSADITKENGNIILQAQQLTPGVYFLKIKTANTSYVQPVVKQ